MPARSDATLKRLTLVATIVGSGITLLDGTVVNVALPTIQRALGGSGERSRVTHGTRQTVRLRRDRHANEPALVRQAVPDRVRHRLVDGVSELIAAIAVEAVGVRGLPSKGARHRELRQLSGQAQLT